MLDDGVSFLDAAATINLMSLILTRFHTSQFFPDDVADDLMHPPVDSAIIDAVNPFFYKLIVDFGEDIHLPASFVLAPL